MVKEALSPDISTGDSKLLSNVSKEIIRHTIMETIWVQNTTNLIVACVIVIASEVVTKVYTDNALPLDNTKFTNAFLNAMKNNMKVAAKEISLLCNSPGILKSLEKGLILCTGLYKNGILLAPACANWISNEVEKHHL